MWRWITIGFTSLAATAAGAFYWFREAEKEEPELDKLLGQTSVDRKSVYQNASVTGPAGTSMSESKKGRVQDINKLDKGKHKKIPAYARHLWLLDLEMGEVIEANELERGLGVAPILGWPTEGSIVIAGFISPENLKLRKNGMRVQIRADEHQGPQIAAITGQAVPLLTLVDQAWQFKGFFRFSRPAGQSVACSQLLEPPAELLQLISALEDQLTSEMPV